MTERLNPEVVRSAAELLRQDLLAELADRSLYGEPAVDDVEIRRFIWMIKKVEAVFAPDATRLYPDVERLLEEASIGRSASAQLLAVHGWELLGEPDQALEELTHILTRADVTVPVQMAAVDAIWRLDGVSQSAAAREVRRLTNVLASERLFATDPQYRPMVAAALLATPGSEDAVRSILRDSDDSLMGAMLQKMNDYSELGVARWHGLRDDVALLRGLGPREDLAVDMLLEALEADQQLESKLQGLGAADRDRSENVLRGLTDDEIASNRRVPVAVAAIARRAVRDGDDPLLNLALDVLVRTPDHSRVVPDRDVPTREARETFRFVLEESRKTIDYQQLELLVLGLRLDGGDEARSILRLAEQRHGFKDAMKQVTRQFLLASRELEDPRRARQYRNIHETSVEGLLDALRSPWRNHDVKVMAAVRMSDMAQDMTSIDLARLLSTPDPDPLHRGVTGRTMSEAIVDVLTERNDDIVDMLADHYLTSPDMATSVRTAFAERFGADLPNASGHIVRSPNQPFEWRVAALSSLAERTLGVDLYRDRVDRRRPDIDGPEVDGEGNGLGGPSRTPPVGDTGPGSVALELPTEDAPAQKVASDSVAEGSESAEGSELPDVTDVVDLAGDESDYFVDSDLELMAGVVTNQRTRTSVQVEPDATDLDDLSFSSVGIEGEAEPPSLQDLTPALRPRGFRAVSRGGLA